ncbi:ABC transporter ATP-binding protein [Egicoccus halophilus]|uniref:Multidrug ABC transporter ATP-binding protein n=1 Tax=Egicoccus halophilus TaxID=1670830 RepID=A0A8J3AC72_9ACTN|nr:ABC transporter ATP-binding protein [Egicoccus halophilus]GGI04805.1 multidrug ABC transporter ATP-binding protein [Egicoccus halophilus]
MPAGGAVIEVQDLRMRYGDRDVLDGVDLAVGRGEVVVLLGPNGAGKTTTVEVLEGFRRRSGGQVRVLGVDPDRADEAWRARVGTVFQSWRDHGRWRVDELLRFLGRHYAPYATAERRRPRHVDELLAIVGLAGQARQRVKQLSGGQRRRLDVAIGLLGHPELLFLDEPTTGFDPQARRDLHELLHRLVDLDDTTIVLTTHDLHEAEQIADRIVILARGVVVAEGSADELTRRIDASTEVRWCVDGIRHVHVTDDAARFVAELERQHGRLEDLQVRRPSLEDAYLHLVEQAERAAVEAAGVVPLGGGSR